MSQAGTIGTGGSGGSGITTIDGDIGSVTGSTVSFLATPTAGTSVSFSGSGTTMSFNVTDSGGSTLVGLDTGGTLHDVGNTGFGASVLSSLNSGSAAANSAFGRFALQDLVSGSDNSAFGSNTLGALTAGSSNTGIGTGSLNGLDTGSNNSCLGFESGSAYETSESNNICIGNQGSLGDNNIIRIGTQGSGALQQNQCFVAGITGVTTSNSQMVTIDTVTGQLGSAAISGGTVTSVSGTANRITSTGGSTPVIDIASTYVGQTSITTLGTVATGSWNATTIAVVHGGTGLTSTTANQILYSSASNTIAGLATANNGVLVTNGSGVPSISTTLPAGLTIPASSGGSLVLISAQTASNVASINFTNIGSFFDYMIVVDGVMPITNTDSLQILISTDNGATYKTTGYVGGNAYIALGTGLWVGQTSTSAMAVANSVSSSAPSLCGTLFINQMNTASFCVLTGNIGYSQTVLAGFTNGTVGCSNPSFTAVNALQFKFSTGNISAGNFAIYGISKV